MHGHATLLPQPPLPVPPAPPPEPRQARCCLRLFRHSRPAPRAGADEELRAELLQVDATASSGLRSETGRPSCHVRKRKRAFPLGTTALLLSRAACARASPP